MRIIGGRAGGRLIKVPKGWEVRPTPDRVRQALFSSLGERVVGARVLELFAGTGALGLECLSRDAASVVCVEKSECHARFLRDNLHSVGLETGRLQLRIQDAFAALGQLAAAGTQFDLVLADPPYGKKNSDRRSTSFAQQLLDDQFLPQVVATDGRFVVGHTKRDTLDVPRAWFATRRLQHGDTVMLVLARVGVL